jgi:D-Tyr-tRNAtyr deacylase
LKVVDRRCFIPSKTKKEVLEVEEDLVTVEFEVSVEALIGLHSTHSVLIGVNLRSSQDDLSRILLILVELRIFLELKERQLVSEQLRNLLKDVLVYH